MLKDSVMQEMLARGEAIDVSQCEKEGDHHILTNYQDDN